jgi:hypothetical protein
MEFQQEIECTAFSAIIAVHLQWKVISKPFWWMTPKVRAFHLSWTTPFRSVTGYMYFQHAMFSDIVSAVLQEDGILADGMTPQPRNLTHCLIYSMTTCRAVLHVCVTLGKKLCCSIKYELLRVISVLDRVL